MNCFDNKYFKISGVAAILLLLFAVIFLSFWNKNNLHSNHKFTVGKTFKISYSSYGGDDLFFYYNVGGKRFESTMLSDGYYPEKKHLHKRFYVMYDPDDPQNSELQIAFPVPDSIIEAPPEGWDKIPNIPDWQQPK